MKICVIGTGYVGLVSGACFADLGNTVLCVDKNVDKIEMLNNNQIPIYEPGLEELVKKNYLSGRLKFTSNLNLSVKNSDIIFICVGTPTHKKSNSADLKYVFKAASEISASINKFKIIITKSTVPVSTGDKIEKIILKKKRKRLFEVVSNPEFLREGEAIRDFRFPDRIIVGSNNKKVVKKIKSLYEPLIKKGANFFYTNRRSAELIKYASNAFLATKISFINEIANICEALGADIKEVAVGMGSDPRIGEAFLDAGIGYGGSCFPKDVKALAHMASEKGRHPQLLHSVMDINADARLKVVHMLKENLGQSLNDKTIGLLGLAFKPNTDDMREAPSIEIALRLIECGANVRAYDPVAIPSARRIMPDIFYAENPYELATNCDALVVVTEWNEFKQLDLEQILTSMRGNVIIDGRNIYSPEELYERGFVHRGIGRSYDTSTKS